MSDAAPVIVRLRACRNAGEMRTLLGELCTDLAEVLHVTALCGTSHANTLCVVDFVPGTTRLDEIADRVGGKIFGLSSVVINLALHPEFACPKGFPEPPPACSCTLRK